ncbi:MAG: asparagine synthase (glutamine-hydrolyzing) [Actinomycetota bacterium]
MCGIAGFTNPGPDARAVLARMTATMVHRGPDSGGAFADGRIAFGHRRLTIIDPNGGAQPRVDDQTGDALVFNGEIYGYHAHARELRDLDITLADHSDTEVLFQSLRHFGVEKTLERMDGMFAFAFRDGASGRLVLARDRFGEKPLFYAVAGGELVFASEIKAVLCHPRMADCGLDPDPVDDYLALEFVPGEETGWKGIRRLLPGHVLVYDGGQTSVRPYWSAHVAPRTDIGEAEALEHLDKLLVESVRQRLVADVPVGVFLSGGIDSSLIAAIAHECSPSITAYTLGMVTRTYDESGHAQAVARHLGLRHEVRMFDEAEVVQAFERVTGLIDEPFADYSLLPTHLVCTLARAKETVALGGDGADELFAGYSTFNALPLSVPMAMMPKAAGRLVRRLLSAMPEPEEYMPPSFIARQLSLGFGYRPEIQSLMWLGPFSAEEKQSLWRDGVRGGRRPFPELARRAKSAPRPLSVVERVLDLYLGCYLPDDILTKIDRAAMYTSLETRTPFLSREFAEFALSLPQSMKVKGRTTKVILKKLAERRLPPEIVHRKKQGFGFPMGKFINTVLREQITDTLMSSTNPMAGWFRREQIERLLAEHRTGFRNHRKRIWSLFVLFTIAGRRWNAEDIPLAALS